ncbi:hypothetical protein Ndes2526B_g07884 [Nannochloris sp. 'desiccata']
MAQYANTALNMNSDDIKEGFEDATRGSKPRVALPTPDQDNENHRSAKRLRSGTPDVSIDPSEYQQYDPRISSQAWLVAVARQLTQWVKGCVTINEKCQYIPLVVVVKLALAILKQTIKNNECDESPLRVYNLHALSAASLWVAIKFAAPRECLPGTSFMSMVVGVNRKLLREAELHVLECIDWDVYALAKQYKLTV